MVGGLLTTHAWSVPYFLSICRADERLLDSFRARPRAQLVTHETVLTTLSACAKRALSHADVTISGAGFRLMLAKQTEQFLERMKAECVFQTLSLSWVQ